VPADPSRGRSKKEAARQRIAEKRAAEAQARAAAQRRRRTVVGAVVAAVAVVVAVVVVIVVQTQRTSTSADAAVPAGTVEEGTAVPVGQDGAPVVVDVYEDFQCPACASLEEVTGPTLAELAEGGSITLRYRPIAFLDRASTTDYSTRALNAAGVVLDAAGPDAFAAFHDLLFANQPPEGGTGLSDDELVDHAAEAGATGESVEQGIRELRFEDWAAQITEAASQAGVTGTPTVLVDGEELADRSPEGLRAAVDAAAG
jgi:protein-disulfide isomerase